MKNEGPFFLKMSFAHFLSSHQSSCYICWGKYVYRCSRKQNRIFYWRHIFPKNIHRNKDLCIVAWVWKASFKGFFSTKLQLSHQKNQNKTLPSSLKLFLVVSQTSLEIRQRGFSPHFIQFSVEKKIELISITLSHTRDNAKENHFETVLALTKNIHLICNISY